MKRFSIPLGLAVASVAHGQATMAVLIDGRRAGTAVLNQRLTDKGGKVVDMKMDIQSGDDRVHVESERSYDPGGNPVRMFQQVTITGKDHDHHETIVTFDEDGANVVIDDADDRTTKHIPLLSANPRQDRSEFWFVRDQPIVGETVVAYRFNIDTLVWEQVTSVFKGMRPVTTDGRRELANVISSELGTEYLDLNGLPLRLELPNSSMERQWEDQPDGGKPPPQTQDDEPKS